MLKTKREKGGKPMWGIRPHKLLVDYVQAEIESKNAELSSFVVGMLQESRDLRVELGIEYFELERQARVDGITVGEKAARLLKPLLKRR